MPLLGAFKHQWERGPCRGERWSVLRHESPEPEFEASIGWKSDVRCYEEWSSHLHLWPRRLEASSGLQQVPTEDTMGVVLGCSMHKESDRRYRLRLSDDDQRQRHGPVPQHLPESVQLGVRSMFLCPQWVAERRARHSA